MINYTKEEMHEALNWHLQNGFKNYTKIDIESFIRVRRKFKILNIDIVVLQSEPLCGFYEPDNTKAMNCKHCGAPQFMHD